ncbi:MAG: hypothetical protein HUU29_06165 [Planctomycetaceae bacterium]|nr:hypothetical protein [Planctomycetaceae bacterium]
MAVFHPNHDELHGFTVVITTKSGVTYIGRWDHEEGGHILLNDASVHQDGGGGISQADFIKQTALWGVRVTQKQAVVERSDVVDVQRLGDVAKTVRGW